MVVVSSLAQLATIECASNKYALRLDLECIPKKDLTTTEEANRGCLTMS
jgi:hypothetical protein